MRIAFFSNYAGFYGANRSLFDLIVGLQKYGVEACVVMPEEGIFTSILSENNIPYFIAPIQMWMHSERSYSGDIFNKANQYLAYLREDTLLRLKKNIRAIQKLRKKFAHVDLIYTNTSVIFAGFLLAKYMHKPHIWHLREFGDKDYDLYFDLNQFLSKIVIQNSSSVIAISYAIRKHFLTNAPINKSIHVIYNGIASQAKFDELYRKAKGNKQNREADKPFTFAIVGILQPTKRQDEAIQAFKIVNNKFPNTKLVIAGSARHAAHEQPLRDLVKQLGISEKVDFYGFVDDPFEIFLNANASLMCSRNEGMGRVTVESMAAYCPVIGYDNAGTAEIIKNKVTGLLYKGDYKDLASCMIQYIEEPLLAESIAENGWKEAKEKYCTEQYVSKIYNIINALSAST